LAKYNITINIGKIPVIKFNFTSNLYQRRRTKLMIRSEMNIRKMFKKCDEIPEECPTPEPYQEFG
jgi:hypothetical protein